MAFKKGQSGNPGGRPAGVANKVTQSVKGAITAALNDGAGATKFFLKLKNSKAAEDRRTFAQICARLVPHELTGPGGTPLISEPMDTLEFVRRFSFMLTIVSRHLDGVSPTSKVEAALFPPGKPER